MGLLAFSLDQVACVQSLVIKMQLAALHSTCFLDPLGKLPITVVAETPERVIGAILSLAGETGHSSYDASCLDLAMREGLPLATLDESLAGPRKRKESFYSE